MTALRSRAGAASDLIEGGRGYFQWDEATYVREYERPEIADIAAHAEAQKLVAFRSGGSLDAQHCRLLVVASVHA